MELHPIEEWLSQLPEPERSKALANRKNTGFTRRTKVDSMRDAIAYGFDWYRSEEGIDYWLELSVKYQENPIPFNHENHQ